MTDQSKKVLEHAYEHEERVAKDAGNTKIILQLLLLIESQREALDRQSHPHIESFCKERAREALTQTDETLRRLGER